jgi:hypothetical protein
VYRVVVGKPKKTTRHGWEGNIKMDLAETGWEGVGGMSG